MYLLVCFFFNFIFSYFSPANHILLTLDLIFHIKILDVILVTYSCITNYSQIERLKTITFIITHNVMGQLLEQPLDVWRNYYQRNKNNFYSVELKDSTNWRIYGQIHKEIYYFHLFFLETSCPSLGILYSSVSNCGLSLGLLYAIVVIPLLVITQGILFASLPWCIPPLSLGTPFFIFSSLFSGSGSISKLKELINI